MPSSLTATAVGGGSDAIDLSWSNPTNPPEPVSGAFAQLCQTACGATIAIGVDEITYRRGQRYLISVVDHRAGAIVWRAPGRNYQTLQALFGLLGERRRSIRAGSIDMSGG